jgi:peptidoglycan/xylan/chitin deacetylase (PgdA/CDA1 family)
VLKFWVFVLVMWIAPVSASTLDVPVLRLPLHFGPPRVALTFDACSGKVDERILTALVEDRIKSTVFVTGRWLKRNPQAIAIMQAHPELFEIENHGARHVVAIDAPMSVFGVKSAGSAEALGAEVKGGGAAVQAAFGHRPKWFRGATATYVNRSEEQIEAMGFRIAGFSRLGDGGAMYSESRTAKSFADAQDGDVIIAHINQPLRTAGAGVVEGIATLKDKGFEFVRLDEAFTSPIRRGQH